MKKIKIILILCISIIFLSGCEKVNLDNAKIYTTIYPIQYITESLYKDNGTIESIYPAGVNLEEYTLTSKQIDNYSQGDLFVYIGLSKERELAKSFVNNNHDLLIIDATYGLSSNNIEELWLAPNNFLMLAKNVKNSFCEYLDNSIKEEEITKAYDKLYEQVSWLDAELRNIAKDAKESGNNTIVIAYNSLKFLENYGFNVVSIEDIEESGSQNAIVDLKSRFKSGAYTNILKLDTESNTELVNELISSNKASVLQLDSLITNNDTSSDYVTIQYENIAIIRDLLLK